MAFAQFNKPVTVTRQAAGAYVGGKWVPGAATTVTIQASVQPATARDMQRLPEGRRQAGAIRIYTRDTLMVEQGAQKADLIVLPSGNYEVAQADEWQNGVLPHNAYLCVRVV